MKAVVAAWLQRRSDAERAVLEPWIHEFFFKALELYRGLVRYSHDITSTLHECSAALLVVFLLVFSIRPKSF